MAIVGTDKNDKLYGTSGDDVIIGSYGDDILFGNDGNDILDGGDLFGTFPSTSLAGKDTIYGGDGDDFLISGRDSGKLYGGNGNDDLNGNNSNDLLDGGAGNDNMYGFYGNDTYVVDSIFDKVIDIGGTDTVISYISYTAGDDIENLKLIGTSPINGTGNNKNNIIIGNSSNNIITGWGGQDTLVGGLGRDIFRLMDKSKDAIRDFSVIDDTIQLENKVFTKLAKTGVLDASNFKIGNAAFDNNDYIIYQKSSGTLFYDDDGNGHHAAVKIAVLGVNLQLTNNDFTVI